MSQSYVGTLITPFVQLKCSVEQNVFIIRDYNQKVIYTVQPDKLVEFIQAVQRALEGPASLRLQILGEGTGGVVIPVDRVKTLYNILIRAADKMGVSLVDIWERAEGVDRNLMEPIDLEDL